MAKVEVNKELHLEFKAECAKRGVKVGETVELLIKSWLSGSQATVEEKKESEAAVESLPSWAAEDKVEVEPQSRTTPQSIDEMLEEAWK